MAVTEREREEIWRAAWLDGHEVGYEKAIYDVKERLMDDDGPFAGLDEVDGLDDALAEMNKDYTYEEC